MLTEYALTPHVLDAKHNAADPEWLERLRAFGERLLPLSAGRVHNNVVSDLCDSHWYAREIAPMIDALQREQEKNVSRRIPALDLLKAIRPRLERHLVGRPFTDGVWPQDEETWAREALASSGSSGIAIHRVVTSAQLATNDSWTSLTDATTERFWEPVAPVANPRAKLEEQLSLLRRMTAFYSFIAFVSPYISAEGMGKDLTFAVSLARVALERPAGFAKPSLIDFHTEGVFRNDAERQNQAMAILDRVSEVIGDDVGIVRLFLWRDVKERRLIVGHSDGNGGTPQTAWAVAMTHVVRPDTDSPDGERHAFSVLPRAEASRLASGLYNNTQARLYPGSPFRRAKPTGTLLQGE